jgi:uncharacterized protein YpuA (DUF1002 family)
MKDKFDKLTKNIGDLKNKATKIGQDAAKAAGTVKEVVNVGVSQSKQVIEKAGKVVNKNAIGQGIEAASKGLEIAATGAKIAANTFEKTASGMKQVSQKLKNKKNTD